MSFLLFNLRLKYSFKLPFLYIIQSIIVKWGNIIKLTIIYRFELVYIRENIIHILKKIKKDNLASLFNKLFYF